MSWSSYLVGEVDFIHNIDNDRMKKAIKLIANYAEIPIDKVEDIPQCEGDYTKHEICLKSDEHIMRMRIHSISYASHVSEQTVNVIGLIALKNRDIVKNVALSLYYLQSPDYDLYIDGWDDDTIQYMQDTDVYDYWNDLIRDGIVDRTGEIE